MKRIIFSVLCFLAVYSSSAQITVSSGFSKDTVQLGEVVNYTITAKVNPQVNISSVDLVPLDSIISIVQSQINAQSDTTGNPKPAVGDYSIDSYGRWNDKSENKKIDITELSWDSTTVGNQLLLENTFKISFWDAGPNLLKTPTVVYELGGITSEYVPNNGAQIFVAVPIQEQEMSDSMDIAPIKPIIIEERDITDFYPFFYALGLLIALPLIYLLYKKITSKPVEPVKEVEVIIPAHTIALNKLESLRETKLWQNNEVKEYQSQLTYTIREYLENRYGIQALESSTDEIVKELRESNFDPKDEADLKTILQVADLVKFAKAKPSGEIHEEFLNTAFSFVNKTKLEESLLQDERRSSESLTTKTSMAPANTSDVRQEGQEENVNQLLPLQHDFAGFWRRSIAHLIDINLFSLLFMALYLGAFIVIKLEEGELTAGKIFLGVSCLFISAVIYYAYPQHKFRKTIGKKLLGIEVVNIEYGNISLMQSIGRIVIRLLSHVLILLPYLSFFFTKKKQTVHDLMAKTIVIKKDKKEGYQDLLDVDINRK